MPCAAPRGPAIISRSWHISRPLPMSPPSSRSCARPGPASWAARRRSVSARCYLHSTGQLHKGGPNTGLFLVVTADDAEDAEIPGMGITFGRLKRAQARGDIRALLARGRRVAHVHLGRPEDVSALATG